MILVKMTWIELDKITERTQLQEISGWKKIQHYIVIKNVLSRIIKFLDKFKLKLHSFYHFFLIRTTFFVTFKCKIEQLSPLKSKSYPFNIFLIIMFPIFVGFMLLPLGYKYACPQIYSFLPYSNIYHFLVNNLPCNLIYVGNYLYF